MVPRFIGNYKIISGPFFGGFGRVYKVFDTTWGDEFALKTLSGSLLAASKKLERFRTEVNLWIDLHPHKNVVRAIEAFEFEGRPWLVMEWVSGGSLKERIPSLDAVNALATCWQICEGMHHIHTQGLVHGDLKPNNILMWGGECPQIADFGLASFINDMRKVIGGTYGYMAPELERQGVSKLSDIYSAGVMFNEIIGHLEDEDYSVRKLRSLFSQMAHDDPASRPKSFLKVGNLLHDILKNGPYWPVIIVPGDDRRTFKEKITGDVLPNKHLISRAHSEITAGRKADAKSTLMEALRLRPVDPNALTMIAELAAEEGDKELALEYLRNAKNVSEENHQLLFNICLGLINIGELVEAQEILEIIGKDETLTPRVWHLKGEIAYSEGELSEAIEYYRQAVAASSDENFILSLGKALGEAGMINESIEVLSSIEIHDSPIYIRSQIILARQLVNSKQYDKGVNTLRRCLKEDLDPETLAYIYSEIGYIYMDQELYDVAEKAFRKSLELDPKSEVVTMNLKNCIGATKVGISKDQ